MVFGCVSPKFEERSKFTEGLLTLKFTVELILWPNRLIIDISGATNLVRFCLLSYYMIGVGIGPDEFFIASFISACLDQNCKSCPNSLSQCEQCVEGYAISQSTGQCVVPCNVLNCARCDVPNTCAACENSYQLAGIFCQCELHIHLHLSLSLP